MVQEEKIIRKVSEIGNGAHIFAPREWLNEEVILVRIPRKNTKEEILKLLSPYLDRVIAVFLYGSYARNEQNKNSDMDIFVISSEKFIVKAKNMEFIIVPEDKIQTAKRINPVLFYSMIKEAVPIINSSYLERLKTEKVSLKNFKEFIEDTKRMIAINKGFIDLEKQDKISGATIYSLILRLRGAFIINSLLKGKKYSGEEFKNWLIKNSGADYEKIYKIYRDMRDDKISEEKANVSEAEFLLNFLAKEISNLKNEKKKEA
ncbi:nucleotidyltransferase domain-containing protein [Candidatus Pacearchaeota archaeon]|nr:nucleotidyltransferase domain-containing protein [Candidatus Pacearchaeota archaeon]